MADSAYDAKEAAIDELVEQLSIDRDKASRIVTRLVAASAIESTVRVCDDLIEPLETAVKKHSDGVSALLARAKRELGGEHG